MSALEPIREQDLAEVIRLLVRAFRNDPFWRWLAPSGDHQRRMERGFAAQLRHLALPAGQSWRLPGTTGAALWSPPGTWDTRLHTQLPMLPSLIPVCGLRRLPSRLLGLERIQRMHPREPHWYLQVLAVDPGHQGQGLSRQLLDPILTHCDEQALPCWLETATPDNISLYRRFGFEIREELRLPGGGPLLWGMWRKPARTHNQL